MSQQVGVGVWDKESKKDAATWLKIFILVEMEKVAWKRKSEGVGGRACLWYRKFDLPY